MRRAWERDRGEGRARLRPTSSRRNPGKCNPGICWDLQTSIERHIQKERKIGAVSFLITEGSLKGTKAGAGLSGEQGHKPPCWTVPVEAWEAASNLTTATPGVALNPVSRP